MKPYHKNSGYSINVPKKYNFDSASERDTYFSNHPNELKSRMYCIAANKLYRYGENGWEDVTTLWKGPRGEKGDAATIQIGTVVKGETVAVVNSGTSQEAVFNFIIPKGDKGDKGDTGSTGASGLVWKGQYSETETYIKNDAVRYTSGEIGGTFFCTLPENESVSNVVPALLDGEGNPILDSHGGLKPNTPTWDILSLYGAPGDNGEDGKDSTITIGTVTTGEAGTNVKVENSGDATNAILNFDIPKGDKGNTGDKGLNWKGEYNPDTNYLENDTVFYNFKSWICVLNDTKGVEPTKLNTANWNILVEEGTTPFIGATNVTNGEDGLVPAPQTTDRNKVLTGDGKWGYTLPHPKTAIPYWGTLSELQRGWQLCDGSNGTPDLRAQFIRGARNDAQVGTEVGYTTALPNDTTFTVSEETHDHQIPSLSGTAEAAGEHDHGSYTENVDSTQGLSSAWRVVITNADQAYDYGFETAVSSARTVRMDGGNNDFSLSDLPHYHNVIIQDDGEHTHSVSIDSNNTLNRVHSHTLSGGDLETAPRHILMYWITYTGELAPNWNN